MSCITINNTEIKLSSFPNNETLVNTEYLNKLKDTSGNNIVFKYSEDGDILKLIFVLDHLTYVGCLGNNITITYMPYSRMDRSENGSCFTLRHLLMLLVKYTVFNHVFVVEPHSKESLADNSIRPIYVTPLLCKMVLDKHQDIDTICFPDKGAKERYIELFKDIPELNNKNIIYCNKKRDFNTGNIIGLDLVGDTSDIKNVLIADDLCSKGGTFYYTAQKLKENNVENVYLAVTHMETNVINGELVKETSPIIKIYTTDSMSGVESSEFKKLTEKYIDITPLESIIIEREVANVY